MGLFGFIADKGREMQEAILQAQMRAEKWDNWDIMRVIKRTSNKTEIMDLRNVYFKNIANDESNMQVVSRKFNYVK